MMKDKTLSYRRYSASRSSRSFKVTYFSTNQKPIYDSY